MKSILTMTIISAALFLMNSSGAWAQGDVKDLYLNKCATCHGPDGAGKTAMGKKLKIKNVHDLVGAMSAEAMVKIVTDGKGQDMDAYGKQFKPDQIKGLVEYYRSLGK
jgi:mono/diheme cytochrome c family protein